MITHTIAKSEDGKIQINFVIPYDLIKTSREKVAQELSKQVELPGFRKGMAPADKAMGKISQEELVQKTLAGLLPKALAEVITNEKLTLGMYPKMELVSAKDNEAWQVTATSCSVPSIELGNYKDVIAGEARAAKLTTEIKDKESFVLSTLIKTAKTNIPHILIEEEVNVRLSKLLERVEKLGLNLDSYLTSVGKNPEGLRTEYDQQTKDALTVELALNKIAELEKIEVPEDKIEEAVKAASTDPKVLEELKRPEQRSYISAVLKRQEALSRLVSLT